MSAGIHREARRNKEQTRRHYQRELSVLLSEQYGDEDSDQDRD